MNRLVEKDNILEKLDHFNDSKCPILIYGDTSITLKQTTSIFRSESKFAAMVDISVDQTYVLDDDAASSGYCLHIYVYHKESNKPIIRCDISFNRLPGFDDTVSNVNVKVNYHNTDAFISSYDKEQITIHNIVAIMFENQIDDIKGNDLETYKYYLKNLRGALEFALIDFIKGE